MLLRQLTQLCLVSVCMVTNAWPAGHVVNPAVQLQLSSHQINPIRPAVLEIPLPSQTRRAVRVDESAPMLAPAAVQWISGPLPLRCQSAASTAGRAATVHARSCLVI